MISLGEGNACSFPLLTTLLYRKTRDELSHNVFLMLQETNKFREHQARQNLIELLEEQIKERRAMLGRLRDEMAKVDGILEHS